MIDVRISYLITDYSISMLIVYLIKDADSVSLRNFNSKENYKWDIVCIYHIFFNDSQVVRQHKVFQLLDNRFSQRHNLVWPVAVETIVYNRKFHPTANLHVEDFRQSRRTFPQVDYFNVIISTVPPHVDPYKWRCCQ